MKKQHNTPWITDIINRQSGKIAMKKHLIVTKHTLKDIKKKQRGNSKSKNIFDDDV